MAQLILKQLEQVRERSRLSWRNLCVEVPYSTIMRWRKRSTAGDLLLQGRGPKKATSIEIEQLYWLIASLPHGLRRTRGTGALCRALKDQASRRLIRQTAKDIRRLHMKSLFRIQWLLTGAAWTIDGTQYAKGCTIVPVQDMASKYRLPALLSRREDSDQIAAHLDELFTEYGPPLFLKRDNGSPFNADVVDAVLRRHVVIPLNNPPYYPRYNGSMERNIRELKRALHQRCGSGRDLNPALHADLEAAIHGLNHKATRTLHGETPCGPLPRSPPQPQTHAPTTRADFAIAPKELQEQTRENVQPQSVSLRRPLATHRGILAPLPGPDQSRTQLKPETKCVNQFSGKLVS